MIEGKLVKIRPVEHIDIDLLYEWNQANPVSSLFMSFRYEVGQLSREEIRRLTDQKSGIEGGLTMVVEDSSSRQVVAFAQIRGVAFDTRNGELRLVAVSPEWYDTPQLEEAAKLLLRYLFRNRNMHKVHIHCLDGVEAGLQRLLERVGFGHSGTLREQTWDGERYLDVHDYYIFRRDLSRDILGDELTVPSRGGRGNEREQ